MTKPDLTQSEAACLKLMRLSYGSKGNCFPAYKWDSDAKGNHYRYLIGQLIYKKRLKKGGKENYGYSKHILPVQGVYDTSE